MSEIIHIYKTVYVERDDVEGIEKFNVIYNTDYGTSEILADEIQNRVEELKNNPDDFDYTLQEFEEEMRNSLGNAYDMLLKGEIDLIQVIYE